MENNILYVLEVEDQAVFIGVRYLLKNVYSFKELVISFSYTFYDVNERMLFLLI